MIVLKLRYIIQNFKLFSIAFLYINEFELPNLLFFVGKKPIVFKSFFISWKKDIVV